MHSTQVNTRQILWNKSLNIYEDNHFEQVFKVCAQSDHFWPRGKLLRGSTAA